MPTLMIKQLRAALAAAPNLPPEAAAELYRSAEFTIADLESRIRDLEISADPRELAEVQSLLDQLRQACGLPEPAAAPPPPPAPSLPISPAPALCGGFINPVSVSAEGAVWRLCYECGHEITVTAGVEPLAERALHPNWVHGSVAASGLRRREHGACPICPGERPPEGRYTGLLGADLRPVWEAPRWREEYYNPRHDWYSEGPGAARLEWRLGEEPFCSVHPEPGPNALAEHNARLERAAPSFDEDYNIWPVLVDAGEAQPGVHLAAAAYAEAILGDLNAASTVARIAPERVLDLRARRHQMRWSETEAALRALLPPPEPAPSPALPPMRGRAFFLRRMP